MSERKENSLRYAWALVTIITSSRRHLTIDVRDEGEFCRK